MNFEKVDQDLTGVGQWRNRNDVARGFNRRLDTADFLARLWSLFGAPHAVLDEGFVYSVRHVPSGIVFNAYCAGSGPSYSWGASRTDERGDAVETVDGATMHGIVQEFEELLMRTPYADCAIEFDTDYGNMKVGCKDGELFEEIEGES